MKFTFLSKFTVKFIEVAGAGLASALCAYFLGQIERPPPAPTSAVVYISPTTLDNPVREDQTRSAAVAPVQAETQPEQLASAPTAASAAKPAKPASVAVARRNQKPEPGPSAEVKARTGEPLPIQPTNVAANSAPKTPAASLQAPTGRDEPAGWSSAEEEGPLLARLKQIPSWFLPENDRIFGDLPRPPMPVGDALRSAM